MALIICSECGNEFSDKAPACPKCGCPTELARPQKVPSPRPTASYATTPKREQPPTKSQLSIPKPPSLKQEDLTPATKTTTEYQQTQSIDKKHLVEKDDNYMHNRSKCNPLAIGAFVGFIAPFTSIIWGVRQRSWTLGLVPVGIAALLSAMTSADFSKDDSQKYIFQALAGAAAFGISRKLKTDATEKGFGTPDNAKAKPESPQYSKSQVSTFTNNSVNNIFSGTSTGQSTKKFGGIALTLIAAGGGVMISRGIREAIKSSTAETNSSNTTNIAKTLTPTKDNTDAFYPWRWDIYKDCHRAKQEIIKEARKLHPSKFSLKYEVANGETAIQDWSKTAYWNDPDKEITWRTVYSSLTINDLIPNNCEVRDIYDHKRNCSRKEIEEIPWTSAERIWVKKASIFKNKCS